MVICCPNGKTILYACAMNSSLAIAWILLPQRVASADRQGTWS
jgi:hypothetical protein